MLDISLPEVKEIYLRAVRFFRVVMSVASQWMMYVIPIRSLLYSTIAGLVEMLVLGVLYELTLRPAM